VSSIASLSAVEERLLESLSIYRYLTADQMVRLGVSRDKRHLYNVLGRLLSAGRAPKEIGELDFGAVPGKGRLSRLYFLTKRGARLLENARKDLENVPYVVRATKFNQDYWHRVYTVDFHIALRAFAAAECHNIRYFKTYFEYARQNQPVTRVKLNYGGIVPDAVSMLDCFDGYERLIVVEMANGSDIGRIEKQIERYLEAIQQQAIERAVGAAEETPARILFVFEYANTLQKLRNRIGRDQRLELYSKYFFCKPLDGLHDPSKFRENWSRLTGSNETVPLFGQAAQRSPNLKNKPLEEDEWPELSDPEFTRA
jgi:hypothetical protein